MKTETIVEDVVKKDLSSRDVNHFSYIFWFIVGLTAFGMFLTIYIITIYPKELSSRFADTGLIFWLSTAVSGGIGYLIGSSFQKSSKEVSNSAPGKVTADITANITSEPTETPETK
jgi:hypothetical protein